MNSLKTNDRRASRGVRVSHQTGAKLLHLAMRKEATSDGAQKHSSLSRQTGRLLHLAMREECSGTAGTRSGAQPRSKKQSSLTKRKTETIMLYSKKFMFLMGLLSALSPAVMAASPARRFHLQLRMRRATRRLVEIKSVSKRGGGLDPSLIDIASDADDEDVRLQLTFSKFPKPEGEVGRWIVDHGRSWKMDGYLTVCKNKRLASSNEFGNTFNYKQTWLSYSKWTSTSTGESMYVKLVCAGRITKSAFLKADVTMRVSSQTTYEDHEWTNPTRDITFDDFVQTACFPRDGTLPRENYNDVDGYFCQDYQVEMQRQLYGESDIDQWTHGLVVEKKKPLFDALMETFPDRMKDISGKRK